MSKNLAQIKIRDDLQYEFLYEVTYIQCMLRGYPIQLCFPTDENTDFKYRIKKKNFAYCDYFIYSIICEYGNSKFTLFKDPYFHTSHYYAKKTAEAMLPKIKEMHKKVCLTTKAYTRIKDNMYEFDKDFEI